MMQWPGPDAALGWAWFVGRRIGVSQMPIPK